MKCNYPPELPISRYCKEIAESLKENQVLVISGETGSGKTTQLPKICLDTFPKLKGMIGCTQPRRVAATSIADRVSFELKENGYVVGCKIRFHDKTSRNTRIKFMTDGILLAETARDPLLEKYEILIIDEAHERSLNIDFLLGYLRNILSQRPTLKVIITSATIDTELFSKHFNNAPILKIEGKTFPVQTLYFPPEEKEYEDNLIDHCVTVVNQVISSYPPGDILVFLPTEKDIRSCCEQLEGIIPSRVILPMFGRLQAVDQKRIFQSHALNKIVIATNVAETSITVPGISYVIDSGFARISSYNPRSRTTSLPITRISQASCRQRTGRAGRLKEGICFRLFSREDYLERAEFTTPEIQRANLAEVILKMVALKLGDPFKFPFVEPPLPNAIRSGYRMLEELGAITKTKTLTRYGQIMSDLPIDPVISRIIIEASRQNCLRETAIIASALAIQDPFIRPSNKEELADKAHKVFTHSQSDFFVLLNIWQAFHDNNESFSWSRLKRFCTEHYLSFQRMREWFDLHEQLVRILKQRNKFQFNDQKASYEQIHRSMLSGLFRQCARRKKDMVYQISNNKEIMIFPGSHQFLKSGDWIIAGTLLETTRLYGLIIATIEPQWIEDAAKGFCSYSWTNQRWQKKTGRVIADETVSLQGLVIIHGRTVNFAKRNKKNIPEARKIFIQNGLVEETITGNFAFLKHNSGLISQWQEAEHRLRKKDIVYQDSALYDFYDKCLPPDICDRTSLLKYINQHGDKHLYMSKQDVLLRIPENSELADYPQELHLPSGTIDLSYLFDPGQPEDGVTAHIPLQLIEVVKPAFFEWLVPGLLKEKTTFLLKGLPKRLRKHLIPINQTVDRILDDLILYRGNYLQELSKTIFKFSKLSIHREDWPQDLPEHLRMRFVIIDQEKNILADGRNLEELSDRFHESAHTAPLVARLTFDDSTIKFYEDRFFTSWDFTDVPHRIPMKDQSGVVVGHLFAALCSKPEHQSIVINYYNSWKTAVEINSEGTRYLIQLSFKEYHKQLKKHCKIAFSGPSVKWLESSYGSKAAVIESLLENVKRTLTGTLFEPIIEKTVFDTIIKKIAKDGYYSKGQKLVNQIIQILRLRKEVYDVLIKLNNPIGAKADNSELYTRLYNQLESLLPADFLERMDHETILDISRHLKSLKIRIERAHANPAKDLQKQMKLKPYQEALVKLQNHTDSFQDECKELFEQYNLMVKEFQISLFSPEIKTKLSVSPGKLNTHLKKLRTLC